MISEEGRHKNDAKETWACSLIYISGIMFTWLTYVPCRQRPLLKHLDILH